MLPQLSFVMPALQHRINALQRRLLQGFSVVLLLISLAACSGSQPPRALLNEALSLQIQLTQTAIAASLELPPITSLPKVSRIRVENQQTVRLGEAQGLQVRGRFDWQLPGDPVQVDSAFDVVLERGERGQSWRLARPTGADAEGLQRWLTYPLGKDQV